MAEIGDIPFDGAYWVEPGSLMAGPHPGGETPEESMARVGRLMDAGIRVVINLVEEREENEARSYEALWRGLGATRGLEVHHVRFEIWDMTAPSEDAVVEILDVVDACMGNDLPVYVHCMAGLGRTGVVVGCWLARKGVAKGRGVQKHIARLRRDTSTSHISSPITKDQLGRVKGWKPGR